jgi:hypothetical protein
MKETKQQQYDIHGINVVHDVPDEHLRECEFHSYLFHHDGGYINLLLKLI